MPSDIELPNASRHKWLWRISMAGSAGLAIIAFVISSIVYVNQATEKSVWNPLGDYPVQIVDSRVSGIATPALSLNDSLTVRANKCNNTNDPVEIQGRQQWIAVDPAGTIVPSGSGDNKRLPGCTAITYDNAIPDGVRQRVLQFAKEGRNVSIWKITGTETPVKGKVTGEPRYWTTENFTIFAKLLPGQISFVFGVDASIEATTTTKAP
jgi:hypothetical protein